MEVKSPDKFRMKDNTTSSMKIALPKNSDRRAAAMMQWPVTVPTHGRGVTNTSERGGAGGDGGEAK